MTFANKKMDGRVLLFEAYNKRNFVKILIKISLAFYVISQALRCKYVEYIQTFE